MFGVYFYTIYTALFSTLIAVLIGTLTAYFTSRRQFFGRKLLLLFTSVPLCVPPLIIALGYISFFGMNGTFNNIIKCFFHKKSLEFNFLYTTLGVILVQGFYNFPLVTGIVHDAWVSLPKEQENAARMCGASEKRIFFTITLKQLSGAIGAAAIPVFLFCFFSFMIVLLFSPSGKSTLEVEIYHSVRSTFDLKQGTLLAILETVTAVFIVFLYSFVVRRFQTNTPGLKFYREKMPKIGKIPFASKIQIFTEMLLFIAVMMLVVVFFIAPGFSIVISAFSQKFHGHSVWTFLQFKKLFTAQKFRQAFFTTFITGLGTGLLCTLIGFLYSVGIRLKLKQTDVFYQTLPLVPMAISSVVVSWLLTIIFRNGTVFLLIIAQSFLYWPVAYRQCQNGINMITAETDMAAMLLSRNKADVILRVYLPSCKKVLFSAFGYCFAISAGDATLPLVLSIPDFTSLSLYTYQLAGAYRFNQSCACGLMLIVFCSLIFNLPKFLFKRHN